MGRRIGKCCRLVVAGGGETNQNMAKMGGGGGGRTVIRLPPGFRFQPTDEELVMHYLRRKVLSCPLPASIIPDIQLSRFDPWDLPGGGAAASSGDDRYLFNLRMGKCRNSNRANRAAGSGFWKATGKDKLITSSRGGHVIGIKKFLVFYRGKPLHGRRTDWVMHEYYYLTAADPSAANYMGDWVLCHTFQKKRPFARRGVHLYPTRPSFSSQHLMTMVAILGSVSDPLIVFTTLLLLLIALLWTKFSPNGYGNGNAKLPLPPGPIGWPFVGNLFQVVLQNRPFMHVVRDLRTKYGPIFSLKMGQRTLIVVTTDDLIHEALIQRGPLFASRPPDSPTRLLFSVGKCTVNSAEYGPLWRALRKNFISELVSPAKVKQFEWIRDWAMDIHVSKIRSQFNSTGVVKVMDSCRLTLCRILVCICFGARLPDDIVQEVEEVVKEVMIISTLHLADFLPLFTPLFRGQQKKAKALRQRQKTCFLPLIRARRAFIKLDGDKNYGGKWEMVSPIGGAYVDSLYELSPEGRNQLGDEELVTLCSEVISAGTDTSATALEWALLEMVLNQDIQEKLYKEITSVVGKEKKMSESDIGSMEYLSAVVKESLRRHPPSHFVLSHSATTDAELGGYFIPKDANVEFYTAWLTENPKHWKNPEVFSPERFMKDGDGAEVDITGKKAVRMMPFGVGRRICPAYAVGTLHIQLMLARMVREFRWAPLAGDKPDPTATFAFTVVMKNPLRAAIYERE